FEVLELGFLDCLIKGFSDEGIGMALCRILGWEQKLLWNFWALYLLEISNHLIGQGDEAGAAVLGHFERCEAVVKVNVLPAEIGYLPESEAHRGSDEHHAIQMRILVPFAALKKGMQILAG